MADEIADKTEVPTLHRQFEARRDGKLAISAELSAGVICLAALVLLQQALPGVIAALRMLLIEGLSAQSTSAGRIGTLLLQALAPLAIGLCLVAVAVYMIQTRLWVGWKKQSGVLDFGEGLRRIFNGRSGFALLLNLVKLSIVVLVVWSVMGTRIGSIADLQTRPADDLLARGMSIVFAVAYRIIGVLIVLGIIDYAYQRRRLQNELRMTRREVRDELRRQEGDPEVRRRRRTLWQAWKARGA